MASAVDAEEVRRLAARFVTEEDELIYRVRVTGPNQINLRVRITETQREVMKEFGINWDIMGTGGDIAIGLATGNPIVAGGASTIANAASRAQAFSTRQSF